jgi:hypothetical protein
MCGRVDTGWMNEFGWVGAGDVSYLERSEERGGTESRFGGRSWGLEISCCEKSIRP